MSTDDESAEVQDLHAQTESWLIDNRIDEVEAIIPDMAGVPRGKFFPARKFLRHNLRLPESVFLQAVTGDIVESDVIDDTEPDMIMQPDLVPEAVITDAIAQVREKKGLPAVERLRLETFSEGRCAQVLHVGPFSEEGPTIERLHAFILARSGLRGKHHEIYLSDIRRAAPKNWKTVIRQPME